MSDFYREKAKEDQLNKQVDEIYDIVFTGPKWLHLKFAEKYEKKLIMNEIKNSSYEEVKASKIKLAETNKTKIDSQAKVLRTQLWPPRPIKMRLEIESQHFFLLVSNSEMPPEMIESQVW